MAATRTLLVLYPGAIAYEAMLAAELLGRRFPVHVATPDGAPYRSDAGHSILADTSYEAIEAAQYRCTLIPGGDPGSIIENATIAHALGALHTAGSILGAICAGPILLAKAGLLRGRRFTHGYGDQHREFLAPYWLGASFTDESVCVEANIVTAKAQAHVDFAIEVATRAGAINSSAEAERLRTFYRGG